MIVLEESHLLPFLLKKDMTYFQNNLSNAFVVRVAVAVVAGAGTLQSRNFGLEFAPFFVKHLFHVADLLGQRSLRAAPVLVDASDHAVRRLDQRFLFREQA